MTDPSRNAPRFNVFAQEFVPRFADPPTQQVPVAPVYMAPRQGMVLPQTIPGYPNVVPLNQGMPQPFAHVAAPVYQHPVVPNQVGHGLPSNFHAPPNVQNNNIAPMVAPVAQVQAPLPVTVPAPVPAHVDVHVPVVVAVAPTPAPVPAAAPVAVQQTTVAVEKLSIEENGSSKPSKADDSSRKDEEAGEWERSPSPSSEIDSGTTAGVIDAAEIKKPKAEDKKSPKKDHINLIFCGHVDAGKSTIGGHIMYLCGLVDKRTLEKYEKEAKEMNRESWFYAWALDTNAEERDKGITVEVGRAHFETDSKRYTILDAPGHKSFVPNMISGAAQADVAILVISARKGEFETGFERGGQTREHAMLVKTAGVKHLVVLINKMDESTVGWDEGRYIEIKKKLTPFLNNCGFKVKPDGAGGDVFFMPCSGYTGDYLKEVPQETTCPWFRGPSLLDYLDKLPGVGRQFEGPCRLPIVDKYRDMGTVIMGKLETGTLTVGSKLVVMPNKVPVEVIQIMTEEDEVQNEIRAGENTKLKLKGIEEEDISIGFVLCSTNSLCHTARIFDAQVAILDYKSIICPGWGAVMHAHTCTQEVQLRIIICLIDKKTGEKGEVKPKFVKQDQVAIARFEVLNSQVVCLETFKDFPQLGRFTLRDEGKTVAIGKVLKIIQ